MIDASPANLIAQDLINEGVVSDPTVGNAWPVFVGKFRDDPDNAVMVTDTPARDDGRLMDGTRIEHPGIQLIVRARYFPDARAKAVAITNRLDAIVRVKVTLDSKDYKIQAVSRFGGILSLGEDEAERSEMSINATTTVAAL